MGKYSSIKNHMLKEKYRDGSGIVLPGDIIEIQNIQKEAEFYSIQVSPYPWVVLPVEIF